MTIGYLDITMSYVPEYLCFLHSTRKSKLHGYLFKLDMITLGRIFPKEIGNYSEISKLVQRLL